MKRIIACIKPVPDPSQWSKVRMDPEKMTLIREGIPQIINPLDRHALEAGLKLKESAGGEVVLLSMAPPDATKVLREGLAMGADRAVLLSDPAFAGSDTLATARVLAQGVRWIEDFDLILCGNLSIDGSTAQVSSQLAELLGVPNVMHVTGIELKGDDQLIIERTIESGTETLLARLPLVLSVRKELNKPRHIPFTGILDAETKEIKILGADELSIDRNTVGIEGSPTKMAGLEIKEFKRERQRIEGTPEEKVKAIIEKLYHFGILP